MLRFASKNATLFARNLTVSGARQLHGKASLPPLPYAYNALEPAISETIMKLHHDKHHNTYVTNLNAAQDKLCQPDLDLKSEIALQAAIKFNGGGHINHSQFWTIMAPPSEGGGKPITDSSLHKSIVEKWGSLEDFQKEMNGALAAIQGSGWAWLVKDKEGSLHITSTQNQDTVINAKVIIGIDAWEHAYYPQYENRKAEYFKAFWTVMNWKEAQRRYETN
ncbi:manganese superoxide dismutase [Schizosaccharomyces cryophilus OY26]|uniref:Superoxide dismutase n=1 Tax=Schizosaccharomyces cryophilus (strain OY26 / ATCC MYA-4695 / CBS 11777 / NBRC 106824 / NRRL Y48691) TaxID=653667 RepID=S9W6E7_SCHCR|nr:manganese superoxide dismutase [Schizosaccharomyces cryophilus OY26]EPY53400.1 manganese superoxide dismutase [Schizosaccharomyces cryophilus OY26]